MNTTVVQELAETLPPGNVRAEDIRELGLPFLPDLVDAVSESAIKLASLVDAMVRTDALRFPELPMSLLDDISLAESPDAAWLPEPGPATGWGSLVTVRWVESVSVRGAGSERVSDIEVSESLLGLQLGLTGVRGSTATVHLADEVPTGFEHLVETYLWGHAAVGGTLGDIGTLPWLSIRRRWKVPTRRMLRSCCTRVEQYRGLRAEIDNLVEDVL